MKSILFLFFLAASLRSIDRGCTTSYPNLCRLNPQTREPICKEKYADCDGFEGCSDPRNPYLCSNGECAENFAKCNVKYYNCENLK